MATVNVGAFRQRGASGRVPNAPTGLALTSAIPNPDVNSFAVLWVAATVPSGGTPVTNYKMYLDNVQVGSFPATTLTLKLVKPTYNINPQTTYLLEVSAVNSYGESARSSSLSVTTLTAPVVKPNAPIASAGTVTATSAVINWGLVSYSLGAPTYIVYRSPGGTPVQVATANATTTTATITGLTNSTAYTFGVKAVDPTNSSNVSNFSNTVSITTGTNNPGTTPLAADSVVDTFGINWHSGFSGTYGGGDTVAVATDALQKYVIDLGCRYIRDAAMVNNNGHIRQVQQFFIDADAKNRILLLCGADRGLCTTQTNANNHVDDHVNALIWADQQARLVGSSFIDKLVAMEGINEPNNDGVSAWATHTQFASIAWWNRPKIAGRDSGANRTDLMKIMGPGLANRAPFTTSQKNFTDDYTALGDLTAITDYGANHIYSGTDAVDHQIDTISNTSAISFGSKPLYTTECGYHDNLDDASDKQPIPDNIIAKYAPALIMENIWHGQKQSYWYEGLDDPEAVGVYPNAVLVQANFGLVETPSLTRSTWFPKQQWYAIKRFLALMNDPGAGFAFNNLDITVSASAAQTGEGPLRWKLYQKRNNKWYVVMWRSIKLYNGGTRSNVSFSNRTVTITLGTAQPVAMHKPSTQPTGGTGSTSLTSAAYSTLTSTTSFTVTMGDDLQVLILG